MHNPKEINKATGKSMGELYQHAIERENVIKSLNYNLIVIWENKWNLQQKELNK